MEAHEFSVWGFPVCIMKVTMWMCINVTCKWLEVSFGCVCALTHMHIIIIYQYATHTCSWYNVCYRLHTQYSFLQTHGPGRYVNNSVSDKAGPHIRHLCDFWCFHRASNWLEISYVVNILACSFGFHAITFECRTCRKITIYKVNQCCAEPVWYRFLPPC